MAIKASELKMYRSAFVSDTSANGGIMSDTQVVSGVPKNLFDSASSVERANGSTKYRKMFMKVANPDSLTLYSARVWQETNTVGEDRVTFFPATQRGTQSGITGTERQYGTGLLSVGVVAGATSLSVEMESPSLVFANGDLVRISNKATPDAKGDEAWVSITTAPSIVGSVATFTFSPALSVDFLSGARVSSVLQAGDVTPIIEGFSVSSASGTLVSPSTLAKANSIGTVEQIWTLTFTSGTTYSIYGDTLGDVGGGNITGAEPSHPGTGYPYFVLSTGLFGGVFQAGDTVVFATHPAAIPLWVKRVVPVGCAVQSANSMIIYVDGESQ